MHKAHKKQQAPLGSQHGKTAGRNARRLHSAQMKRHAECFREKLEHSLMPRWQSQPGEQGKHFSAVQVVAPKQQHLQHIVDLSTTNQPPPSTPPPPNHQNTTKLRLLLRHAAIDCWDSRPASGALIAWPLPVNRGRLACLQRTDCNNWQQICRQAAHCPWQNGEGRVQLLPHREQVRVCWDRPPGRSPA